MFELALGLLIVSVLLNLFLLTRNLINLQGGNEHLLPLDGMILSFKPHVWQQIKAHRTRDERRYIREADRIGKELRHYELRLTSQPGDARLRNKVRGLTADHQAALFLAQRAFENSTRRWLATEIGQKWLDQHGLTGKF